uniref:Helicase ATP-binding domain-containing protein n=1 Tax=viral metagenome TaxID=1070528 RepID=A0A6C0F5C4_9ZZZZ
MVKICSTSYLKKDEEIYQEHFDMFPFPLSPFQKHSIEAIVTGNHILVTAHTGSGKTLPAEFAIEYFVKRKGDKRRRVIYTSPIKALSNQKFYEFTKKFPDISFGILTGDLKANPDADVLIMTTEILQNTLYRRKNPTTTTTSLQNAGKSLLAFDMDIENELACVIFDEVHYINDQDRGKVWEETIMMLPLQVQMVMLSATIDSPEKFALWCENRDKTDDKKTVFLASTYERVVPLTHYSFITSNSAIFKILKDKEKEQEVKNVTNKLITIQTAGGKFEEENFQRVKKTLKLMETKNVYVKRQHVLNNVCKHMVENEMLPALCFVFSRKALEVCANEITVPLLEFDSKVGYTVKRECEQIIRKLPNYQEYLELPEYHNMVALLEKGIAIHHAGVMPVLREMVELLYAKGYIKLLFATETFAVGINMPTKTVLFTDINKFDGSGMRMLHSHEYTQQAGRAGRRGIDTVGHVIHLTNLFKNTDTMEFRQMMGGKPQTLVSKFKISFNLILNLLDAGDSDFARFANNSMIQDSILSEMSVTYKKITEISTEIEVLNNSLDHCRTPRQIVQEYIDISEKHVHAANKKRKDIDRRMQEIQSNHKFLEQDKQTLIKYNAKCDEMARLSDRLDDTNKFIAENVDKVTDILISKRFLEKPLVDESTNKPIHKLTIKGTIASHIREMHCLVMAELVDKNELQSLTAQELVSLFSCFTNVTVPEDLSCIVPNAPTQQIRDLVLKCRTMYNEYLDLETEKQINTGTDYNIHFELLRYVYDWTMAESAQECKLVLQTLSQDKEVFLGEFVKALLKINNISSELEKVAEYIGNIELLHKLRKIPQLTLKYVATNQSLYV